MKTVFIALAALMVLAAAPADARIPRSTAAKNAFARAHVCPSTGLYRLPCKGYVVDHVKALACGGADAAYNMQYQTIAAGKAKDRIERVGCRPVKG